MQNQIFIFRTSIKNKQDIKRIKTLFTQYPTIHKECRFRRLGKDTKDRMFGDNSN